MFKNATSFNQHVDNWFALRRGFYKTLLKWMSDPNLINAHKRVVDSALKNKSINDRDPITMEPICDCAPIFSVVTEAGHKYSFDAKNLLNYVLVSGKVQNPITRDPLNDIEAHRLAKLCNYGGALDSARPKLR